MTTNNTTISENFLKTYTDKTYQHTTMIRHNGVVVAFAMDGSRRIYYTVLNLDDGEQDSPLDVNYWLENPQELGFPNEISQVGYAIAGSTLMPIVKKGSRQEAELGTLRTEEIDPFLSSTARLTADAPFQALSDEKYVYIFRQSIAETDEDMVFKTESGGASGDSDRDDYVLDIEGDKVPIVKDTLLVDRFVLAGTQLSPTMEVRYQRSRHKTRPLGSKDSLGAKDLNGNPFFEPTQELAFVCHLQHGRFSALLLPTQIAAVQRWQIFAHNSRTGLIDSFNIERGADGLFNTKGTQLYTSPDPQYQSSVLEREPGKCPFTDEALIPIVSQSDYAESALAFDGQDDVEIDNNSRLEMPAGQNFTLSAWLKTTEKAGNPRIIAKRESSSTNKGYEIYIDESTGCLGVNLDVGAANAGFAGDSDLTDGQWHHIALVLEATTASLYLDGKLDGSKTDSNLAQGFSNTVNLTIAGKTSQGVNFKGQIDEVRIWNRARAGDEP